MRQPSLLLAAVSVGALSALAVGVLLTNRHPTVTPRQGAVRRAASAAIPVAAVTRNPRSRQWAAAMAAIAAASDTGDREGLIAKLLEPTGPDHFARLVQWLDGCDRGATSVEVRQRLLREWAASDPAAAAAAALALDDAYQQAALAAVLVVWANNNAAAAMAWVDQLPEGPLKQGSVMAVGYEMARSTPETVLEHVAPMAPGADRDELICYTLAQWSDGSPNAAADWVDAMDAGPLQLRCAANVATTWAATCPLDAAAFAMDHLPDGRLLADVLVSIAQRWVQTDPQGAGQWVGGWPQGDSINAAMENIVKLWADQEPAQAGEWLNSLPPSASRDSGIRAYSEQVAPAFHSAAVSWAHMIQDPLLRQNQLSLLAN